MNEKPGDDDNEEERQEAIAESTGSRADKIRRDVEDRRDADVKRPTP